MSDPPERDPLADLVSRSVGARVERVDAEPLDAPEGVERRRLRFSTTAGATTAIFERARPGDTLEARLVPFLARKSDRVPIVHARGLPPPHAALGPWLLVEDVLDAPSACEDDPLDVLRAKIAIERAVADDAPALRALGVRSRDGVDEPLRASPVGIVHGALTCATAHRTPRGVVIAGWGRAFLGPLALDAASLASDLERRGDRDAARRVRELAASEYGVELS